ncbi:MAG: ATP-dependent DNA helicase RecG [Alphaproteobacteria bacterium]|nr:ATP-dependent DNA helicase RecG [Alphaproteobacteria bacterium]
MTRPDILAPLFDDVTSIKGVGNHVASCMGRLLHRDGNAKTVLRDVLFHAPVAIIDRRFSPPISEAPEGVIATFEVEILQHFPPPPRTRHIPYRILCSNDSGRLNIAIFHARKDVMQKQFPMGEQRIVSGRVEYFNGLPQISHPDYVVTPENRWQVNRIEPIYPLTAGISQKQILRLMAETLKVTPLLPEWCDKHMLQQQQWSGWKKTLTTLHRPTDMQELTLSNPWRRVAYDELLANQLALAIVRKRHRKQAGLVVESDGHLYREMHDALPFELTTGQNKVLQEIHIDMASGARMLRLLQGDVGSGKTVVAMLAMAHVIAMKKQAALMAPTDILARQHAKFFRNILSPLGLRVELLTGKTGTAKEREALRTEIAQGAVDVVIGTHALFQESVAFADLALVVVDEQHRFGVAQRMQLAKKAKIPPHILLMTATPIPRSLTMTIFGDMDSSILSEKPAGRQPIDTRVMPLEKQQDVVKALHRAIANGNKIYWICPLVEEAEENSDPKTDLAAAEARHKAFEQEFGGRVGLVHGRMKPEQREPVMQGFAGAEYDVLVATTVIEVGVDVPDATVMVIEHAERFGLSQLHQLRGRVGRGSRKSSCILLYGHPAGEVGEQRLRIMRETEDGFRIAEEDMRLRGAGDVLGTRQSGVPNFYFADLVRDSDLALIARDDAKLILHSDPQLETARGKALRVLLYLFSYDENIRYLRSG